MPWKHFASLLFAVSAALHAAAPTTIALTTSAPVAEYGQPVTLTASVTPSSATGNVTFYSGTTILATEPLAGGQAKFTTALLPAGTLSLNAYYGGDTNDAPSTSALLPQTVLAFPGSGFAPASTAASFPGAAYYMAVGDFNGDGKADLAITATNSFRDGGYGVNILLGNGDATFQAPVFYLFNFGEDAIGQVAVGDFNNDGVEDLAVAFNLFTGIMLGNGDGTFSPPQVWGSGSPQSLAVADFNGDGNADIVVGGPDGVGVLLGIGNGTFYNEIVSTLPGGFVAVGDFNGDGRPDIAVTPFGGAGTVLEIALGNGDGSFQSPVSYTVGTNPQAMTVGNWNGDGKADIAVVNYLSNTMSILLGNGDGTFQTAVTYPVGSNPASIGDGDFNGDGIPDLAVANLASSNVSVLLGNGNGTFQPASAYATSSTPDAIAVADFNLDGRADLAVAQAPGTGSLSLLPGSGPATAVKLESSPNPSGYGQTVTLTGLVSPAASTGTVTFYNGSTALGTRSLTGGAATLQTSSLSLGTHSLTATYGAASSPAVIQTVNAGASETALTSSPNPSTYGEKVTMVAAVSPATATGTVTFYHGSTVFGTSSVSKGKAGFTASALPVGSHGLTATYNGDQDDLPSTAPTVVQVVEKAPTTTALSSSPNPSVTPQKVTFTATVAPATATGTVTFQVGTTILGTAMVNAGVAVLMVSTLPVGSNPVTASYSGDANDGASKSPVLTQFVEEATTTTLASSPNPSNTGQKVTLTATVTPSAATGSVAFYHGTTLMGTSIVSAGVATYSTRSLSKGTHSLTATYQGALDYQSSSSPAIDQVVK
jgi:hypothetical protein